MNKALIIHCRKMIKAYNRYLFTSCQVNKQIPPGNQVDSGQFTRQPANNIHSPGSDKLTEVKPHLVLGALDESRNLSSTSPLILNIKN